MKILKEYLDGFRWHDGDTSSAPFEKDSDQYIALVNDGCEVVIIPDAEKEATQAEKLRGDKLAELATIEQQQTPRILRNAALGDQFAIDKLAEIEASAEAIRAEL